MERKLDLKKDQKVVVAIIERSNMARNRDMSSENIDNWCFDGIVTKVGRKYITVKWDKWSEEQFDKEKDYNNKTEYSCDYKLYLNREEIFQMRKTEELYSKVKTYFSGWGVNENFTLDQLERILTIINENK